MRATTSVLLWLSGIAGFGVAVIVQFDPATAARFLPPSVDPALARTFAVVDALTYGALPLAAARMVATTRRAAPLCVGAYLGATGFAALWAWTAAVTADLPVSGAVLCTAPLVVALWAAALLRPGAPLADAACAADRTIPPERTTALYDGACRFCVASMTELRRRAPEGTLDGLDLRDPAVGARFPGLPHEALLRELHVVTRDGRVHSGVGAVLATFGDGPGARLLRGLRWVPGVRSTLDVAYALVASVRTRLPGRSCAGGACRVQPRVTVSERPDSNHETA